MEYMLKSPNSEIAPQTPLGQSVTRRLQAHMQDLKDKDLDPPFFHFVRPHLTELYEYTVNYKQLIVRLTQYEVFTDFASKEIIAIPEWNKYKLGPAVYDGIKVKGLHVIPKLINAFEKTGNGNMIEYFDEWLKQVEKNKQSEYPAFVPFDSSVAVVPDNVEYPQIIRSENIQTETHGYNNLHPSTFSSMDSPNVESIDFTPKETIIQPLMEQRSAELRDETIMAEHRSASCSSGRPSPNLPSSSQLDFEANQTTATQPDDANHRLKVIRLSDAKLSVKDFICLVMKVHLTLQTIDITDATILPPFDSAIMTMLKSIRNLFGAPVELSSLEFLKLSIRKPHNYKKVFKQLLFFIQGKSKLNRLWQVPPRIRMVDLECENETIIKFDKGAKELVVNRFRFIISPDSYLQDAASDELLKFACFKNRVTLEKLNIHRGTLTELILNICDINTEKSMQDLSEIFKSFKNLQTLIIDCGSDVFTIDVDTMFKNSPKLQLLVIGHCRVILNGGYRAMKSKFVGKKVTFFNCIINDTDLLQDDGNMELSIDETGTVATPVKTQWNTKKILKDPFNYKREDERRYFDLFQMDKFSTYDNRYFCKEIPSQALPIPENASRSSTSNNPTEHAITPKVNAHMPSDYKSSADVFPGPSNVTQSLPKNPDISPATDSMAIPIANLAISQNRFVPSTAEGELLASKLKKVVNYIDLKNNFEGVPLEEIFDGYSTHLNKSTIITDNLVTLLKDMRVLDEGAASKIMKTKDTEHVVCCNTIYDRLFKNRNVDYLIHMWEKTTNNGLISWTKNWLDVKYPQPF